MRGAQTRQEFGAAEWFGDIIIGPGIERSHFPFFIVAHRKNDDRHLTPFAQTPQHIHAIGIGKSEIEQDNIGPSGGRIRQTLRGGFGLMHLIVSRFQNDA